METREPTVSVVVCAYTMARAALLDRALSSVRSQTHPALEILLVVDHCRDLLDRSRAMAGGVRVCASTERRGLSGARNTGVARAHGDVVAFLDDDAAAAPDWLARLVRPYANPHVVGVGGHVIAEWEGGRPAWFPREFDWVVGCSYVGQPTDTAVVRNPIGANMSFRRQALVAAGGFSADVGRVGTRPTGCEETEVSIRLTCRDPASMIVLEPRAIVRHHVPRDRSRWSYFWRRCWAEGLSKASVSRLADQRAALSSERAYVLHVLPRAAVLGLADAARRREVGGAARAVAIGAGLTVTASGFVLGKTVGKGGGQGTPTAALAVDTDTSRLGEPG
jgi:cellulose synthase/poly-beta-1,6-N-acetylglucosamine synthase-like glycosyltransferase